MSYPVDGPGFPGPPSSLARFDVPPALPPRPPKFQGRTRLHVLLLLLTITTTTLAGADHYAAFASEFERRVVLLDWLLLLQGVWYSGTLLAILGAHEMGHYVACRRYDVDATLPFFIPMPPFIFLTGTLGAVIKIREAFPTRKVLFDIGIAGPIAGFVLLVPALFCGMMLSYIVPAPTEGTVFSLGEPLLFRWATQLVFGTIPDGYTVNMHPMVFAAWFGMLATALNLLPFGQLDGGHVVYTLFGRWHRTITFAMGIGLLVIAAAKAAASGAGRDEVTAMVRESIEKVYVAVALDTLEFLQKGGRVGKAQAWFGSLLAIKPMISLRDGEVVPLERVRTRAKSIARLYELLQQHLPAREIAVVYSTDREEADMMMKRVAGLGGGQSAYLARFGPVLGTYVGPNSLAVVTLN